MRKLVFILLAFIAAITFIRAYDTADGPGRDISDAAIILDVN
jgi:predicted small secreted protein